MNTAIIEKVLDVICEELSKKWYGYDTNVFLRDSFVNSVMSYENIVSRKYLEYLFIHMNIETNNNKNLIEEFTITNIFDEKVIILKDYTDNDNYDIISTQNSDKSFTFSIYEKTNTIEKITCDYSYLSNYEYCDVFEE